MVCDKEKTSSLRSFLFGPVQSRLYFTLAHKKRQLKSYLFWRRRRDSNPRYLSVCRFSRPVHSTALPLLRLIFSCPAHIAGSSRGRKCKTRIYTVQYFTNKKGNLSQQQLFSLHLRLHLGCLQHILHLPRQEIIRQHLCASSSLYLLVS